MKRTHRRGTSLVEVMAGTSVLAVTVLVALAIFPTTALLRDRSGSNTRAAAIIQRKLDQVRSLDAASLTPARLQALRIVDTTSSGSNSFTFTGVDDLASKLDGGTGTLTLINPASDLVQVQLTLTWRGMRNRTYSTTAVTFVADRSVWKESP